MIRAILCRNGVVKQITIDHEPKKEKELVESRGGFVSEKPGTCSNLSYSVGRFKCAVEKHVYYFDDIVVRFQNLLGVCVLLNYSIFKLGLVIWIRP